VLRRATRSKTTLAPILEELELRQPKIVTKELLGEIAAERAIRLAVEDISERLQRHGWLNAIEVERLVSAIEPRYQALIYTASYLGLRWHEIAGLRRRYLELAPARPASLRVVSTIERSGGRCRVSSSERPRRPGARS
jgi:integrase